MRLSDIGPTACEAAFKAWRAGSGPFLPYVRSTPFVSLARYSAELDLPAVDSAQPSLPDHWRGPGPGELLLLDLPAAACLATGLTLWAEQGLWPVLTFAHWYHPRGIVGRSEDAAWLLCRAPSAPPSEQVAGYCLLLDHGRFVEEPLTPDRFNNQYELTEDDLPTAAELRGLGYSGLALVTADPPKTDLKRYAAYLSREQFMVRWQS